ncbi:MAG: hypothetical protein JOZ41_09195 [Chloroflexi bacterium]|nr:hypothetical protein [Chloroflexota bacterium]
MIALCARGGRWRGRGGSYLAVLSLTLILGGSVAGCRTVAALPAQPTAGPAARPAQPPRAPAGVAAAVAALQGLYDRADWAGVRRLVADGQTASNLLRRLQAWHDENVRDLRISLVYQARLSPSQYVGTVEFAGDTRAVPDFSIFRFSLAAGQVRITGTADPTSDDRSWTVTRTAHFVVYHSVYQLRGSDRRFLADLEYQRARFAREFGVQLPSLAVYHLYPDTETMNRLTGGACGAIPGETGCTSPYAHPPTIQAVLRATYHEPIHVYELALSPPPPQRGGDVWVAPLFISEGTAVALEDRAADPRLSDYCSDLDYAPLDDCARIAAAHIQPTTVLSDRGFRASDPGFAYSLGGSFVKYLILHYGYRPFGRFYYTLAAQPSDRLSDYDVAARRVYHRPMQSLLTAWRKELCGSAC